MKAGIITIAGKPNAGKSTLINAFVGEKVAIVTRRPQTTRNKITGIVNGDGYQAVFIDTPGLHNSQNKLGDYMQKSVDTALQDVDGLLYVVNGEKGFDCADRMFLEAHLGNVPVIVALNKIDKIDREKIFSQLNELNEYKSINAVIPISAMKGDGVSELLEQLVKLLPEGAQMYPEDMFTDRTLRFMAAEIIREKALVTLDKEIPYGIGVSINKFEFNDKKNLYEIDADIVCERASHKPIIIGKGGQTLKKIATAARVDIENLCGEKVFMELWVRVKENWRDSDFLLKALGYDNKDV